MRKVNKINEYRGGKVIAGAMNRPGKHQQGIDGNVQWWDSWGSSWIVAPFDSCRHAGRYTHWRANELEQERT